ncbi:MAG: nucleotidyl transferase AbiEii/AbiGii toxin family protein [FCB group bacterium]|jgi:hypothetical protein|nr:nucleotidyl transferase AbiEii/AbiGii toxin family protein [FCB group bacterium]
MSDLDLIFSLVSETLPAAGIDCLLIGGFAVNHYGYSRSTLDIDLMIATEQRDAVRKIMQREGFTNVALHDNVMFVHRPGTQWRVDILQVDRETMAQLLSRAEHGMVGGKKIRFPALKDLLAMKFFALGQNPARRMGKDLPDIAHLAIHHGLDPEKDLHPLALRFASEAVYELVANQIGNLRT